MKQPANMCMIRNTIVNNTGKKVVIRTNRGRNRFDIAEGTITDTYPSIFKIKLEGDMDDSIRNVTYSYKDVLTKEVELVF